MVGTTLKLRTNENDTDNKFSNIKKFGATTTNSTTEVTKRAAFGEIQNRGVLRAAALTGKDAVQKDLKDTKLQNALRNTKARVDTQWKKGALGGSSLVAAAATTKTEVAAKTAATGAVGERKILTRANSVRQITTTTTSTANAANGLQRHASSHLILGQKQTKTLTTTRLVENKLQQVKLVNKAKDEKVVVEAKASATTVTSSTTTTTLRREDSNLSRKSLTKLRAALASNKNSTTKATAAVSGLIAKKTTTQTATSSSSSTTASANAAACTAADIKIVSVQTHSSKFLEAVEDIDAADGDNLALVSEYVNDIYNYLYTVEVQQSIVPDHLEGQAEVTPKMRAVLIDWINEVHFQFRLAPETFQMAIAIIDRYLQVVQDTKRTHLQLVGVTALFIATKYEELLPPAITDFVFITDDTYTAKQIRQMELKILKALDYNLARPLPIHFLRRYSKAAYAEDRHHGMSKYFLELAAVEYDMAAYKPSEVAASSLFLAMNLLNDNAKLPTGLNNKHWTPTLEHYSRYTPEHLRPIAKKIAAIARNAQTAKLRAAFNKYESIKMDKISLRPELYGPLMDSIIKSKD